MWISSFVVTILDSAREREQALSALRSIPCLEIGGDVLATRRVSVVLETAASDESHYWYDWIEHLPGVLKVDLAFVTFEEIGGILDTVAEHQGMEPKSMEPIDG